METYDLIVIEYVGNEIGYIGTGSNPCPDINYISPAPALVEHITPSNVIIPKYSQMGQKRRNVQTFE